MDHSMAADTHPTATRTSWYRADGPVHEVAR